MQRQILYLEEESGRHFFGFERFQAVPIFLLVEVRLMDDITLKVKKVKILEVELVMCRGEIFRRLLQVLMGTTFCIHFGTAALFDVALNGRV
jgi:hypothetical protein